MNTIYPVYISKNNNQFLEGKNNNSTSNKETVSRIPPITHTRSTIKPIINNQEPDFIINNEVNNDIVLIISDKKIKNKKPNKITSAIFKLRARFIKGRASYTVLNAISVRLLFIVTYRYFREIGAYLIKGRASYIALNIISARLLFVVTRRCL